METRAVLFDFDGTITQSILDFDQIRREMGDIQGPILEAMETMSPEHRLRAEKILLRHEAHAVENATLNPGAQALCQWLTQQNIRTAVITRNNKDNVQKVCQKYQLHFDLIVTRDDGPVKPDPFPVQLACQKLNVPPENTFMVGDYLYDLVSGRRAGTKTVLIKTNAEHKDFLDQADYVIDQLPELIQIIEQTAQK